MNYSPDAIAFILWNLLDAAEAQRGLALHDPPVPTTEWLDGFGAGRRKGLVEGFAIAYAALVGGSPSVIMEDMAAMASVEEAYPFDLIIEAVE